MAERISPKVQAWVKYLSDENMPVFSDTVTDVNEVVNSDDTSAFDVARVILRDASLTGRLLKMANSIYYNPLGSEISTISRAVMVLGFDQVRVLTMSLILIDTLTEGVQRDKLIEEMALSFHAAIQAQEFAKKLRCASPENVFIAALLSRLGNMAFWAFADEKADDLLALIATGQMSEEAAEIEVLGFSLHQLTRGLSKSWSLGELLEKSLDGDQDDPRVNLIMLGQSLALAAKHGWDESEAKSVIEQVASTLNLPEAEASELVHANAWQARSMTRMYGVIEASKRIPQPLIEVAEAESSDHNNQDTDDTGITLVVSEYPEPNVNTQLTILQDINNAIQESPSINIILEMVLEGIHRGVGMDRALFAILTPDRKKLICKYALGADNEKLSGSLNIDVSQPSNIFHRTLELKKACLIPNDPKQLNGTLSRETLELLGKPPYLLMPTIVCGKVIGLFLADRNASGRVIEQTDFIAFQQFCQQANMGLTFLSMQG